MYVIVYYVIGLKYDMIFDGGILNESRDVFSFVFILLFINLENVFDNLI